jgi:hypothetical protein
MSKPKYRYDNGEPQLLSYCPFGAVLCALRALQ